ncbi:endonuclease domain-containing protein [Pelagovum pacificum]|uniref:Endonuclease domain-containing protein n=1 Tax=Pelagovum pacificum TaxID=2588711 RepID=A0A5C5GFM6_9RHOB|nr:endonuclease domain-containing protein [Pelagovum pacificum]QQA43854.1 endonuclease domain-containing protein [Pelagovum pacificum]TNY33014.1 endonuclease domain-containing protein [Pelagovum pacificum]
MRQTDLSTSRARQMRQDMTPAERLLWYHLRNRRLLGLKFRRQTPLGPFIADFYCAEARLVVEADGGGHGTPRDGWRDAWLGQQGIATLRLWNNDILPDPGPALTRIAEVARARI